MTPVLFAPFTLLPSLVPPPPPAPTPPLLHPTSHASTRSVASSRQRTFTLLCCASAVRFLDSPSCPNATVHTECCCLTLSPPQSARKKQARSVLLHFRGHEARKAKKAKEEQLALRRGASKVARDVRAFWGKLNKVMRMVVVVCNVSISLQRQKQEKNGGGGLPVLAARSLLLFFVVFSQECRKVRLLWGKTEQSCDGGVRRQSRRRAREGCLHH